MLIPILPPLLKFLTASKSLGYEAAVLRKGIFPGSPSLIKYNTSGREIAREV
jgi:hypothetical protein